eukprot:Plantae.Rhodophyta-Hildenbrandia_rubra.ctg8796.p1 GENE.Plantae.Rhodophyta-Hildenbrandia_rubra.ctg8796~~Plantae.Rhodophyta-Hildenbrandia_rubra.ctg8796.p1  ORF type:complete len:376 (-),score=72.05 Plantae.Rhodophyta-Hildenbrandia_rubra.ctg8796:691-1818(-)
MAFLIPGCSSFTSFRPHDSFQRSKDGTTGAKRSFVSKKRRRIRPCNDQNTSETDGYSTTRCDASSSGSEGKGLSEEEEAFLEGPVPGDRIVRTISSDGAVACKVVACTGLVAGACGLHRTSAVASVVFGRVLICGLLMAAGMKGNETLQLQLRGRGKIGTVTSISNGLGEVRGWLGDGRVSGDVSEVVGKGVIAVVRSSGMGGVGYTGLTSIVSGEVAEDVAAYLKDSEGRRVSIGAGVQIGDKGVEAAGGWMLEGLPGCSDETLELAERNVREMQVGPGELLKTGVGPETMIGMLMRDLKPMDVARAEPRYACKCGRDRVERTLGMMDEQDVWDVLREQGAVEATCEFCGRIYRLGKEDVQQLFQKQKGAELSD